MFALRCELVQAKQTRQLANKRTKQTMPLINVKLIEGVFTPKQKQDMIRKLTDTMVAIEGENMRPVTWVVVEEVQSGDWGVGGNLSPPRTSRRWRQALQKSDPKELSDSGRRPFADARAGLLTN